MGMIARIHGNQTAKALKTGHLRKLDPKKNFPRAVYGNLSSTIVYQDCSLQSEVTLPEEQTGISADADIPSLDPVTSTSTPTLLEVM
jgi:hypothetical protein